jgi:hypothetical protein
MTSRRSSGSMRAESAVEPTRSENITVTWRRSARSSGATLGALGVVAASTEGALPPVSVRKAAIASRSLRWCPTILTAQILQVLSREVRQDRFVNLVLAEGPFVPFEGKAPQPNSAVHEGAPCASFGVFPSTLPVGLTLQAEIILLPRGL